MNMRLFFLVLMGLFRVQFALADESSRRCIVSYLDPDQKISFQQFQDLVNYNNEWYEVIIPTEKGLDFKKTQTWIEVESLLDHVEISQRNLYSDLLNRAKKQQASVVEHFKTIAILNKAELRTRIKNIESLRRKIINRAAEKRESDEYYSLEVVSDLIGIRLTLPLESNLLKFSQLKEQLMRECQCGEAEAASLFFAKELGWPEDQILEVEFKGSDQEQSKGKHYRAVHVVVTTKDNTRVEVQLMSKAMHLWHSWDHPKVYKRKNADLNYLASLKKYSQIWVKFIRLLEDISIGIKQEKDLLEFLQSIGINPQLHRNMLGIVLDSRLAAILNINYEDRIIFEDIKGKLKVRKSFYRTLEKLLQNNTNLI